MGFAYFPNVQVSQITGLSITRLRDGENTALAN